MTIEQTLMRSIHSVGGLTRGRGMKEYVMSDWILSMPIQVRFAIKWRSTPTKRAPARISTLNGALQDMPEMNEIVRSILYEWFSQRSPFAEAQDTKLISLSSGIVAGTYVNCYKIGALHAVEVSQHKIFRREIQEVGNSKNVDHFVETEN